MKAIYFTEFKGTLSVVDIPIPVPSDSGVVIKVEATGLCRSDWHAWMGHDSDIVLPHVPGHGHISLTTAHRPEIIKQAMELLKA